MGESAAVGELVECYGYISMHNTRDRGECEKFEWSESQRCPITRVISGFAYVDITSFDVPGAADSKVLAEINGLAIFPRENISCFKVFGCIVAALGLRLPVLGLVFP